MSRFVIVGRKRWEGTLDGKVIRSAKLYAQVQLDSSRNDAQQSAAGIAVEEIRLDDVELLKRLEHLPLPFECEIDTVRVSNGKTARDRVTDVRPVGIVKSPAALPVKAA